MVIADINIPWLQLTSRNIVISSFSTYDIWSTRLQDTRGVTRYWKLSKKDTLFETIKMTHVLTDKLHSDLTYCTLVLWFIQGHRNRGATMFLHPPLFWQKFRKSLVFVMKARWCTLKPNHLFGLSVLKACFPSLTHTFRPTSKPCCPHFPVHSYACVIYYIMLILCVK